jgi:flagellar hook assembly protein FlgD
MYLAARPNPFTASTTVTFELPEEARVSVDVFDVAGRHIRHLGGGALATGPHTFAWDGTDEAGTVTPAGVFIARVTGADISASTGSIRIVRTR